jgi:uncharacterized protein YwgA
MQRLGLPTDYVYSLHFYGPYSEEVKADIGLAQQFGLITEAAKCARDGTEYFVLSARSSTTLPDIQQFSAALKLIMSEDDPIVLELAATYDAFRKMGLNREEALKNVREMKRDKCNDAREKRALNLIAELALERKAA